MKSTICCSQPQSPLVHLYVVSFLEKAIYCPETAGHCSFKQTLHKQRKIVHVLGTIFTSRLILTWRSREYLQQTDGECGTNSK